MGLQLVRWLLSISAGVPFLFLRLVDANECQQSSYTNYPQDVYAIEGQQLCITCKHSTISNNPNFEKNGIVLDCGGAGNPDCTVNGNLGILCFNPINANNLGVMYECVHQIDFNNFCRVGFNISRGAVPSISDSSLTRQLDYDSGSLTLQPTVEHGLPAAIVNWYHNGQLIESGEDTLRIPSMGAIQAEDRGIYVASINNTFGEQSVNYTVIVNNFPPIINCQTTSTPATVTITCEIISYPSIDNISWIRIYNGDFPVPAQSNVDNMEVVDFRASSTIVIHRAECPLTAVYRISMSQSSFDNRPCKPVPEVTNLEVEPVTETAITIRWTNPMIVEPITGYVVEYRLLSTSVWQRDAINNGSATMYTIDGLKQGRNYKYRVQIVVDGIEQAFSDIKLYQPGAIPSDPPLNINVDACSNRASEGNNAGVIVVKWKAVPAVRYNITGYTVTYRTSFATNSIMVPATRLNFTITDAIKAETYYISVQAYNSLGTGPKSTEVISDPLSEFIQNPENQTVELGQEGVNISCALNVTGRVWRWFQRINNQVVSSSSDMDRLFSISNEGILYFQSPVTIRSHGAYQCVTPGCVESYVGHLNVAGVPLLEFFQEPISNSFQAIAGSRFEHKTLSFGYPTPNITLRRKVGHSFTTVKASKVTLSIETFIMNCVDLSDSGDYQIVATNTYGSYMLDFTLAVTGQPESMNSTNPTCNSGSTSLLQIILATVASVIPIIATAAILVLMIILIWKRMKYKTSQQQSVLTEQVAYENVCYTTSNFLIENNTQIDSDHSEVDDSQQVASVVLQENTAYCSQAQLQQNVSFITSTENDEAHIYDDAEIQRIQDDVVLQQNDAYSTQVQLQQNVSYVTSSSENHQHQQTDDYEEETDPPIVLQQNDAYSTQVQLQQNITSSSENHQLQMDDYEEEADPPMMLQQNDAYSTQVQLQQNVTSSSENHQQQLQTDDYEEEADPPIMLQQNDAYSTQVQLQQNVTSSSENHQQQLQMEDYEEEADPPIMLQQNDAYSSQAQLQYI